MLPGVYKQFNFKKITTVFTGLLFVVVFLFFATPIFAQTISGVEGSEINFGLSQIKESSGLGGDDIRLIIARIIRAFLGLLGIIAMCLMLWAGYTIMTAGGNEEKIVEGKKILINSTIGLGIIMSAFAIVQYIMYVLGVGTGLINLPPKVIKPKFETFAGSGALGKIITDHYPERNQQNVPRNTKIMISFAEPIAPESLIINTNNTCWDSTMSGPTTTCPTGEEPPYYGDCVTDVENFDWNVHCDRLNPDAIKIYKSADRTVSPLQAVALISYRDGKAYDFVFRPILPLGDNLQKEWHTVYVADQVQKIVADGSSTKKVSVFDGKYYRYYYWEFKTDTLFDFDPPVVTDVYPEKNEKVSKNTILQINFSEAMDPLMVQGLVKEDSSFTNLVFATSSINGEWKITNGYKTVEFVSDLACGMNSCGEQMFCLPVFDCAENDSKCTNDYSVLIRTAAKTSGGQTFEAVPFSGVMDASGNALDGNKDNSYQIPPSKGSAGSEFHYIGPEESTSTAGVKTFFPDNYGWNFVVENSIDREPPYLRRVNPSPDAGSVDKMADVELFFSKKMWMNSLQSTTLEEYSTSSTVRSDWAEGSLVLEDLGYFLRYSLSEGKTKLLIKHVRQFSPNGFDFYYFPAVTSTAKSLTQNCFYPGYGPRSDVSNGLSFDCVVNFNAQGDVISTNNCTAVNFVSSTDTGCPQTTDDSVGEAQANINSCLNFYRVDSI